MKNNNKIIVEELDSETIDEVYNGIDNLKIIPGDQYQDLDLKSTTGDIHDSLEIVQEVHTSKNVHLRPLASGELSIAGTVLTAAGKPGMREAKLGAKFNISNNGPYPSGTSASGLSEEDKAVLDILSSITGKRKAILGHIIKGIPISSKEAKKCNIIDKIQKFQSKYRIPKERKGTVKPVDQNSQNNSVPSSPSVTQNPAISPVQNNKIPEDQENLNLPVSTSPPAPRRGRKRKE